MGMFNKKKKGNNDISFEADAYYDEMINGNPQSQYYDSGYNNTYENGYNYPQNNNSTNNSNPMNSNPMNSNPANNKQEGFDLNEVVNKKFNYKKVNKKVMSKDEYRKMVDEEYMNEAVQKKQRIKTILFSICIIYAFVLIVGIIYTPFYEKDGQKQGAVITVSIFEERESYNAIREHYVELSKLLIQVNNIDSKMKNATPNDYFDLSSQYQALLPEIDKSLSKAKAMKVDTKYAPIKALVTTTYNDLAIYLQKMGTALNTSSDATFKEAITWNQKSFEDYNALKSNLYQFSDKVKIKEKDSFWKLLQ